MYDQILLPTDGDACIKLIYACQILTKQYRSVLEEVGTAYHVSENELRVLVCLSVYPILKSTRRRICRQLGCPCRSPPSAG